MKKLFILIAVLAIAVSAEAQIDIISNGNVGIGYTNPFSKLQVNGGALRIGAGYSQSDRDVNMINIGDGDYIRIGEWEMDDRLSFKANSYSFTNGNLGIGTGSTAPAQELQKVFPELVREEESNGTLSINYVSMIPILTSAINELQQKIEVLEKRLLELEGKKGGE